MENIKISPSLALEVQYFMLFAKKDEDTTSNENCLVKFDHDENNQKIMTFEGFKDFFL